MSGPFENFPEEVFREVVDINLISTFLACQAVGARMIKANKGGPIINIGSIYGMLSPIQDIYAYKKELTGVPFIKPVAYSAAKSGIYNLTRYLATYLGQAGHPGEHSDPHRRMARHPRRDLPGQFQRIWSALITPTREDKSVNYDALERMGQAFPGKALINGFDEQLLGALSMGSCATIGTTVNLFAPLVPPGAPRLRPG